MPEFAWNPTDFLICLEVEPEVAEYETSHRYTLRRDGLQLSISVWQYHCDVQVSLFREGIDTPVLDLNLLGCMGARYIDDQRGKYLEFAPARCFGDWCDRYDGRSPIPYGVRVAVNPHIQITLFSEPSG
jgi:hypothetical protein